MSLRKSVKVGSLKPGDDFYCVYGKCRIVSNQTIDKRSDYSYYIVANELLSLNNDYKVEIDIKTISLEEVADHGVFGVESENFHCKYKKAICSREAYNSLSPGKILCVSLSHGVICCFPKDEQVELV